MLVDPFERPDSRSIDAAYVSEDDVPMTLPIVETAPERHLIAGRGRWPGLVVGLVAIAAAIALWNRVACRIAGRCP